MKPLPFFKFALVAFLGYALSAVAAELGDAAKPLQIAQWVKGQPVDMAAAKDKNIFVVEFWATWCPPCRTSIPHLTEMQKKFKDKGVVFIGISDEEVTTVKNFTTKMGDKMNYTVAVDKEQKTSAAYMKAFGINGIPHAFIVDKLGRIAWEGHPMSGLEVALEEIISGKFDLDKAKKRSTARKKLEAFYELAAESDDEAEINRAAKELEALDKELGGIEPGEKFDAAEIRKSVTFQKSLRQYQQALAQGKSGKELEALTKQLQDSAPKGFDLETYRESLDLRKTFSDYYAAVTGRGDKTKAPELSKKLGETKSKDANTLNQMAWVVLTDENIKTRDVDLATKLAKAALTASDGKEPAIMDTYARALFDSGKTDEAITYQKKAIAATEDESLKKELEETLNRYQKKSSGK